MNVGVMTEAASRGLRARGSERGRLYIRANDRSFGSECHAECWAKSRRLRARGVNTIVTESTQKSEGKTL